MDLSNGDESAVQVERDDNYLTTESGSENSD
ncbi:hypothetical protein LGAA44_240061 [Leuconostoc gasicomitatum]|nr:hypothetical protein LGAA44_240061 [Leuconostoc gasicomitatum]